MPSERSLPTWWINLWIVIGCFAFVLFFGVPILMSRNVALEYQRFQDCSERRRADCTPSLVWLLSDWRMSSTTILGTDFQNPVPTATSTTAGDVASSTPKFTSIELMGLTKEGETYQIAKVGQKVNIKVKAEHTNRVELFVSDPVSSASETAFPTKPAVVLAKQKDGSFTGTWTYPTNFHGFASLNFHAYLSDKGSTEPNTVYTSQIVSVAIKK